MAVEHMAQGKIKAILYFQNEKGHILLLPTDEDSKRFRKALYKQGYMMLAAETLSQARQLQTKLQNQMKREQQFELAKDEEMTRYRRQQVRNRLVARMNSASCPAFEKEFIRIWLAARENKHDIFRKKFTSEIGHLDALEFDDPNKHIHDLHDRVPNTGE